MLNSKLRLLVPLFLISVITYSLYNLQEEPTVQQSYITEFTKIDDYPLYTARYIGDYRLDTYLETGSRPQLTSTSCTCFATNSSVFGRNFDFPVNPALLLFTYPRNGYASVSMVDLGYFDYSMSRLPGETPEGLEYTPYMPFDGMNEKGLVVSMAAVPYAEAPSDPDKQTLGEIEVIRLLLDHAANVDEAITLMSRYNIRMATPPIHYLVADPSGESAIFEYLNDEMIIYRKTSGWQIITNFHITSYDVPETTPCDRYDSVQTGLQARNGNITVSDAFKLLDTTHQSNTIWSTVYDMERLEVHVCMGGNYGKVYTYQLSP